MAETATSRTRKSRGFFLTGPEKSCDQSYLSMKATSLVSTTLKPAFLASAIVMPKGVSIVVASSVDLIPVSRSTARQAAGGREHVEKVTHSAAVRRRPVVGQHNGLDELDEGSVHNLL